mgnify:CR=1 FL=1
MRTGLQSRTGLHTEMHKAMRRKGGMRKILI